MATFQDIAENLKRIDFDNLLNKTFTAINFEKWAVETIQKRLYDKGITGGLIRLQTDKGKPFYTPKYTIYKVKRGERVANVTLYLGGGFHQSINVKFNQLGFDIETDFKYLTVHFKNLYVSEEEAYADILSLTDKELDNIVENKAIPKLLKQFSEAV